MEASSEISLIVIVWLIIVIVCILRLLRNPERSVGILTVYLITFTATYWVAPAIQLLPSYTPLQDPFFTRLGFVVSFIGLLFFLLGVVIVRLWPKLGVNKGIISPQPLINSQLRSSNTLEKREVTSVFVNSSNAEASHKQSAVSVPLMYYGIGVVSYFVLGPLLNRVPTASAIVSNSSKLLFVGVILLLCSPVKKKVPIPTWGIIASVVVWPAVTILNEGFLGFGLIASVTTLICWLQISGKKLKLHHLILTVMIGYLILSVTETYFVARNEIRRLVWGGAEIDIRTGGIYDAFLKNFQFFGFGDASRLFFIEGRLDLSNLTGIAVERLNSGQIDYANGRTLAEASLMLIPRFLWPDRPIAVGGNSLISQYTGVTFASGTSVATGQVMELYINFGLFGIIAGSMLLGILIAALDQAVARSLRDGNEFRFALCFLPCLGLLLIPDTMTAVVATTGASIGTVLIVNFLIKKVFLPKNNLVSRTNLMHSGTGRNPPSEGRFKP